MDGPDRSVDQNPFSFDPHHCPRQSHFPSSSHPSSTLLLLSPSSIFAVATHPPLPLAAAVTPDTELFQELLFQEELLMVRRQGLQLRRVDDEQLGPIDKGCN
ncbi:hypothetical protein Droror1_Dr00025347 [Drosera rotundifolia]